MKRSGVTFPPLGRDRRSARRPEIARAEAVETCCAMITSIKVAKDAGRCRGGGGPMSLIAWLICGSASARCSSACCSKAWSSLFLPGMILPSGAGIVTRFAPSPTGHLHLGHAYSALLGYRTARDSAGRFLLRIEDIDRARCRVEFEADIYEDLAWLGLAWEQPVRRQSDHFDDYRAALAKLESLGVVYPCFCSRKDIAAAASAPHHGETAIYPGTCRDLHPDLAAARRAKGDAFALRLDVAKAVARTGPLTFWDADGDRWREMTAEPERLGDVVLGRRDAPASYHLCATLDDHIQG